MKVIAIDDDGYPAPKRFAFRLCINCGYCVDVCVPNALRHKVRKHSSDSGAARKRYEVLRKVRKGEPNEK